MNKPKFPALPIGRELSCGDQAEAALQWEIHKVNRFTMLRSLLVLLILGMAPLEARAYDWTWECRPSFLNSCANVNGCDITVRGTHQGQPKVYIFQFTRQEVSDYSCAECGFAARGGLLNRGFNQHLDLAPSGTCKSDTFASACATTGCGGTYVDWCSAVLTGCPDGQPYTCTWIGGGGIEINGSVSGGDGNAGDSASAFLASIAGNPKPSPSEAAETQVEQSVTRHETVRVRFPGRRWSVTLFRYDPDLSLYKVADSTADLRGMPGSDAGFYFAGVTGAQEISHQTERKRAEAVMSALAGGKRVQRAHAGDRPPYVNLRATGGTRAVVVSTSGRYALLYRAIPPMLGWHPDSAGKIVPHLELYGGGAYVLAVEDGRGGYRHLEADDFRRAADAGRISVEEIEE